MVGITDIGGYIPRLRLQRGSVFAANAWFTPGLKGLAKGERAMTDWDEDSITMAVEAARDCLGVQGREDVSGVLFASTSAPFADRQNAVVVKEALNLPDTVATLDLAGGQRAGMAALLQALAAAPSAGQALCIASEKHKAQPGSEAELTDAHAAAAILVGTDDLAASLLGAHSVSVDFVDHFRANGEAFDYGWESRWIRDEGYAKIAVGAVKAALAKAGVEASAVKRFVLPATARGVANAVAKASGVADEAVRDNLGSVVGHSGAAHPLLMLAHAIEDAAEGDVIVAAAFGNGCDVAVFERTAKPVTGSINRWIARRAPVTDYTKYLFFNGLLDLELGMRAEKDEKQPLTALYRNRKAVLALVGGRCTKTGTVQFPKSDLSVNQNDAAYGTQEDYPFADRQARIVTYTADSLTFSPSPPAYYGAIEFEGGGRMTAEFCDVEAEDVEVGRPMRMVFRIKAEDGLRGFTKYFWKATPIDGAANSSDRKAA